MTSWRSRGLKAPLSGEFPVNPSFLVASAAGEDWAAQGVLPSLSLLPTPGLF